MKRVLCIGDSFGLPRAEVDYEETWIALLRRKIRDMDFIALFRRQSNTNVLAGGDYGDTLIFYHPQIIILQLGICDCAPRYLRTNSCVYRILCHMPEKTSSICWQLIKKVRKRKINRTDVTLDRFRENVCNYIAQCIKNEVEKIIIIKIGIPGEKMIANNPHVKLSVERYNQVYKDFSEEYPLLISLVDPLNTGDSSYYVSDGYHPNKKGHELVANALIKILQN